ncbi:AAA family ATPase [Sphingomicrobium clamense]|uniref:AAA family ATPase n=1 Tax=Sphingomicrobium clamense TaxID=2851013 RepID=A0ABS6V3C4_9SPHN|nr:AAA family ATPase [Sphingomicrobium sp. B8]MBW0144062.1 AAA family ATPase [Sphingomicrobium sp. B8]
MSKIDPNAHEARGWHAGGYSPPVKLFLTGAAGDPGALAGVEVAGFPIELSIIDEGGFPGVEDVADSAAAVVQVATDDPATVAQFGALARATDVPMLAAAFDPPLSFVRQLVRAGAHDVIPLPLDIADLETSVQPIASELATKTRSAHVGLEKSIMVIKSEGGVGATALSTQLATRFAANEAAAGRETCLLDMDMQFGDAAFVLGLKPRLTLADLIQAEERLDGALMRTVATDHPSGLKIVSAPNEILPLESLSAEHAFRILNLAKAEFGTVFVDLPMNWTNWSLSLMTRADMVLMVTELSIPSLNRARRQLDLLNSQGLGDIDVRVVVNRFEKGLFKKLTRSDAESVLGREVAYTICNDHQTMSEALERGVPIAEVKRRSALGKDLDILDSGLAGALGLER